MQHWTLCEMLSIANRRHSALNYIDAHAMAPLAKRTKHWQHDKEFKAARACLPGQESIYEVAWQELVARERDSYPNSANFVLQLWKGEILWALCEKNPNTVAEIDEWIDSHSELDRDRNVRLYPGDWRENFEQKVRSIANEAPKDDGVTILSFDPNKYDIEDKSSERSPDLFPSDIEIVLKAVCRLSGGLVIQLSTYSNSKGANPQDLVLESLDSIFRSGELERAAVIKSDDNMMSLVYTRKVNWANELEPLSECFREWLEFFG